MAMVSYTLDAPPPLTEDEAAALRALEEKFTNMPDSEIDLSDCPESTPDEWAKAIPNPYCRYEGSALLKVLERFRA